MNAKEFLNNVSKEIRYKPANKYISDELESHIEELKNDNLCKGLSEEQAEETAVEQMGDAKKIGKRLNRIHRPKLDWKILILIMILIVFRVVMSFKSYTDQIEFRKMMGWPDDDVSFLITQIPLIKSLTTGIILGAIVYFFDYRKTKKWANIFYLLGTLVIFFQWFDQFAFDKFINNILGDPHGMAWFVNMRLWNISIPLYIIAFAGYMADYKKEDFWDMVILYTISCLLIYLKSQSITNTVILVVSYLAILAAKMLQNNKNTRKKVIGACGGVLTISILIMVAMTNVWIPYIFYGPETSEDTWNNFAKTQENQEKILENIKWVGEAGEDADPHGGTNFRFIYILGKLGIIPAVLLVGTILLMSIRLIKDSKSINDEYGKYLIIGLSATYILQSIIQVLMNINILPTSDINLPFVSSGKLYFLINSFTFAVILSVYRRKNINFEEPKKSKLDIKIEKIFWEEVNTIE